MPSLSPHRTAAGCVVCHLLPSRFDFKTEVSGFLVQRLSQDHPSDSAKARAEGPEALLDSSTPEEADTTTAMRGAQAPSSPTQTTPTRSEVSSSSRGTPSDPLLQDDGDTDADADAAAAVDAGATEAVAAAAEEGGDASVLLAESQESKALWKRARPRVRYFTHQARRRYFLFFFHVTFENIFLLVSAVLLPTDNVLQILLAAGTEVILFSTPPFTSRFFVFTLLHIMHAAIRCTQW